MSVSAPYRTRREWVEIIRNSLTLTTAMTATIVFASSDHRGHPSMTAGLAVAGFGILAGLGGFAGISVWQAIKGRRSFDPEEVAPLREACLRKVIDQSYPTAVAVAVRPVSPAPYAGYVWASVIAEPEPSTDPSRRLVRFQQTHGWAISRSVAVDLAKRRCPSPKRPEFWEPLNLAKVTAAERELTAVSPTHLN
jgi:hypothetical protein